MEDGFYAYERAHWAAGELVAGADEAGRGPLAGPVVAAAVIFPASCELPGVADSKKLSERRREALYEEIVRNAAAWAVGQASVEEIERLNILGAARLAFERAVDGLTIRPAFVYTDYISGLNLSIPSKPLVKGDALVYSIAAASIVAKVTRDRQMRAYAEQYPAYGFERNKGYGTAAQMQAICAHGPCAIHRPSFLKKLLAP